MADNKKREREAGEKVKSGDDSDDEELDQSALRNGELEG